MHVMIASYCIFSNACKWI